MSNDDADVIEEFSDLLDDYDPTLDNTFSFDEGSPAATNENVSSEDDDEREDNDPFSSSEVSNISTDQFPKFSIPSLKNVSSVSPLSLKTNGSNNTSPVPPFMFGAPNPAAFASQMNTYAMVQSNLKMGIGGTTTTTTTQQLSSSTTTETTEGPRKRKVDDKAERQKKNREAADKSRRKKRELLESLPARNAQLENRILELEKGLAASQADAAALREQCEFLKQLLMGGGGVGGNNMYTGQQQQVVANGMFGNTSQKFFKPNEYPSNSMQDFNSAAGSPAAGIVMLAVCCIITVNQCGVYFDEYTGGYEANMNHKGRVLLSTEDANTIGNTGLLPRPVVFIALVISVVVCLMSLMPFVNSFFAYVASYFRGHRLPQYGATQKAHKN
jgi:hypothetical protein